MNTIPSTAAPSASDCAPSPGAAGGAAFLRWLDREPNLILAMLALGVVVVLMAGCVPTQPDQCLRAELFDRCMKALPAGPAATKYNDWDEVVAECDDAAYRQSLRTTDSIKQECRVR